MSGKTQDFPNKYLLKENVYNRSGFFFNLTGRQPAGERAVRGILRRPLQPHRTAPAGDFTKNKYFLTKKVSHKIYTFLSFFKFNVTYKIVSDGNVSQLLLFLFFCYKCAYFSKPFSVRQRRPPRQLERPHKGGAGGARERRRRLCHRRSGTNKTEIK